MYPQITSTLKQLNSISNIHNDASIYQGKCRWWHDLISVVITVVGAIKNLHRGQAATQLIVMPVKSDGKINWEGLMCRSLWHLINT